MKMFDIISRYDRENGKTYPVSSGIEILAVDLKTAKYVAWYTGIRWVDMGERIEEYDASDIGGRLGELANAFDPRNN